MLHSKWYKALLVFCILLLVIPCFSIAQTFYYVQRGNQINRVPGDPSTVQAKKWKVLLYKRGESTTGKGYWGVIDGSSAAQVMKKLKGDQEFELKYNAFFGKGLTQDPIYTNFNPLGPIAVLDDHDTQEPPDKPGSDQLKQATATLKDYFKAYTEAKTKLDVIIKGRTTTPFDNYGQVFREYTGNLRDAIGDLLRVKDLVNSSSSSQMNQITAAINQMDIAIAKTRESAKSTKSIIAQNSDQNATANDGGGGKGGYVYFVRWYLNPNEGQTYPSGAKTGKYYVFFSSPIKCGPDWDKKRPALMNTFSLKCSSLRPGGDGYTGKTSCLGGAYGTDNERYASQALCEAAIQGKIQSNFTGPQEMYEILRVTN